MNTREVVAANVRARMGWHGLTGPELAAALGWKQRTTFNKLRGTYRFTEEELAELAAFFGLDDPGPFYKVPDGFPRDEPVRIHDRGLLPSTNCQHRRSGHVRIRAHVAGVAG